MVHEGRSSLKLRPPEQEVKLLTNFMTPQTLEKANQLTTAIKVLEKGVQTTEFALSNKRVIRLCVPGLNMDSFVDLDTRHADQAGVVTGIKVGLEVHLEQCKKDLAEL